MAPGEDATLARDQAAQLLGLPEAFHLAAGWTAVTAANLAKGVPLDPAVAKLIDVGDQKATGGLEVITGVAVVSSTKAIRAILEALRDGDREEGLPVIDHLEPKVTLHHNVEAKRKDIDFSLAQLQGQVKAFIVNLQGDERKIDQEDDGSFGR